MLIFILCTLTARAADGCDSLKLAGYEERLQEKFSELMRGTTESEKLETSEDIKELFGRALKYPESFAYPFDSLDYAGRAVSSDSLVSVYTWNIPLGSSNNYYGGLVQHRKDTLAAPDIYFLRHEPYNGEDFENTSLTDSLWYGALYYQIVPVDTGDRRLYTVIGLDLNDFYTNRKIIDLLFLEDGEVKFGAPLFEKKGELQKRVVYEYSSRVVMHLRYHGDINKIVCDHLSPPDERYRGQYRYYGPDLSYDGFVFEEGVWKHLTEIDVLIRDKPEEPEKLE